MECHSIEETVVSTIDRFRLAVKLQQFNNISKNDHSDLQRFLLNLVRVLCHLGVQRLGYLFDSLGAFVALNRFVRFSTS